MVGNIKTYGTTTTTTKVGDNGTVTTSGNKTEIMLGSSDWYNKLQTGLQNGRDDPLQDAERDPWRAQVHQQQHHPQTFHREHNEGHSKGRSKAKGRGRGRGPKDDETKKKEVHFLNFPEMDRDRHMTFLFHIIERYGFKDMVEMESDKKGDLLPLMYAFGYQFAKSSAIRFKSEEKLKRRCGP